MRAYLQRVWALFSAPSQEGTPLMTQHRDLESYGHPDSDTILLVCEPPDIPAHVQPPPSTTNAPHTHTQPFPPAHAPNTHTQPPPSPCLARTRTPTHTRISPFSEDHFPRRPLTPASNV